MSDDLDIGGSVMLMEIKPLQIKDPKHEIICLGIGTIQSTSLSCVLKHYHIKCGYQFSTACNTSTDRKYT